MKRSLVRKCFSLFPVTRITCKFRKNIRRVPTNPYLWLNILEKVVSPKTVLKHIVQEQTYFRNHHASIEKNDPDDTRYKSQLGRINNLTEITLFVDFTLHL